MLPHQLGFIGIAPRVIDGAHRIERRAVRCEGMARHRNDDRAFLEAEQAPVDRIGGAGDQLFRRAVDRKAVFLEKAVKREGFVLGHFPRQAGRLRKFGGNDRSVPCSRCPVDEAKPVEEEQPGFGRIGKVLRPFRRPEGKETVRGGMARRLDCLGEAQQIAGGPAQRSFGDEGTAALPAGDQALIHQPLDGLGHREAADAPVARQLRLARDAGSRLKGADLLAQPFGDAHIERAFIVAKSWCHDRQLVQSTVQICRPDARALPGSSILRFHPRMRKPIQSRGESVHHFITRAHIEEPETRRGGWNPSCDWYNDIISFHTISPRRKLPCATKSV